MRKILNNFRLSELIFIILILIVTSTSSCQFGDYSDTLCLVPGDSEIIFNININEYFKEKGFIGKVNSLRKLNFLKKFLNRIKNIAGSVDLSALPEEEINLDKDLFPYLKPNFTLAFYDTGGIIADKIFKEKNENENNEKTIPMILIFNIDNKDGVEKFLCKIKSKFPYKKDSYKDYNIFCSEKSCYFIDNNFIIFSNDKQLLEKSLDCKKERKISILENDNFNLFRDESLNEDTIGFIYYNTAGLEENFLKSIPEESISKWKELFHSVKYAGTAVDIELNKLELKTFLVHNKEIAPFAKDFFSINSRKFESPDFFSKESPDFIVFSEPDRVLPLIFSLFNGAPFIEKIKEKADSSLPIPLDTIFISLRDELALTFHPEKISPALNSNNKTKKLFKTASVALKLKEGSFVNSVLENSDTILSLFSIVEEPLVYRGVTVNSVPGSSATYINLEDFVVFGIGENNNGTENIIDSFYKYKPSLKETLEREVSSEGAGISYFNIKEIYDTNYSEKNEDLNKHLNEFFDNYPEIFGNTAKTEDGYIFTFIMPFK